MTDLSFSCAGVFAVLALVVFVIILVVLIIINVIVVVVEISHINVITSHWPALGLDAVPERDRMRVRRKLSLSYIFLGLKKF